MLCASGLRRSQPDHQRQAASGSILLRELGFTGPDAVLRAKGDEWGSIDLSQENTTLLESDLPFLEVREDTKRHEKSSLWSTLRVVKNDRVVIVGNHWQVGDAVPVREVLENIDETLTNITGESRSSLGCDGKDRLVLPNLQRHPIQGEVDMRLERV